MQQTQVKSAEAFPWTKEFEVGIPVIDAQHHKLVDLINRLSDTLSTGDEMSMSNVIDETFDYAAFHFQQEEKVWAKYFDTSDVWYREHELNHSTFLPNIMRIGVVEQDKPWQEKTERVLQILIRWLTFHILGDDKKMANVVLAMKEGFSFEDAKKMVEQDELDMLASS
ncbi:bacteriohemerythrin [Pseudovibrio exalbescens]|uniref:bacteriohemerythrin n=1 Tax=Pseudovibrio exalbescens TaxID=197461 RepID=UPI0023664DA9|nr:bacteriohemerythrin [Pseudovibrio exalbescens]MDD7911488.1 bacteriohemerythrin [Pseudovibrio exalbescens]